MQRRRMRRIRDVGLRWSCWRRERVKGASRLISQEREELCENQKASNFEQGSRFLSKVDCAVGERKVERSPEGRLERERDYRSRWGWAMAVVGENRLMGGRVVDEGQTEVREGWSVVNGGENELRRVTGAVVVGG
ncbi:hypothetical protein HYC85_001107 [Camellia sinensis]|uniref:Uncharacterized protein n=1 Tax=Camellia sinensis TaxID=4442 RepID=A0A7J7I6X8_CAMSI|nr:hypothetical protein HYC85_001107 [Camellia sinensis]